MQSRLLKRPILIKFAVTTTKVVVKFETMQDSFREGQLKVCAIARNHLQSFMI